MNAAGFWKRVDKRGPLHPALRSRCWLWTACRNKLGYGKCWDGRSYLYAHRRSWTLVTGHVPKVLRHRCDNPSCVRPLHLADGTKADNLRDMFAKKRDGWSVGSRARKLSAADVASIRAATSVPLRELAARFGISRGHACQIRLGARSKRRLYGL